MRFCEVGNDDERNGRRTHDTDAGFSLLFLSLRLWWRCGHFMLLALTTFTSLSRFANRWE